MRYIYNDQVCSLEAFKYDRVARTFYFPHIKFSWSLKSHRVRVMSGVIRGQQNWRDNITSKQSCPKIPIFQWESNVCFYIIDITDRVHLSKITWLAKRKAEIYIWLQSQFILPHLSIFTLYKYLAKNFTDIMPCSPLSRWMILWILESFYIVRHSMSPLKGPGI